LQFTNITTAFKGSDILNLKNLPELNFVEADIEKMLADAKAIVEASLGRTVSRADPIMLLIKSLLAIICQLLLLIDRTAKQNLLYYAEGDALEHIGAEVGVERLPATNAQVTCNVKLSADMSKTVTIVKDTRVNSGDEINFALDEDLIFLPGEVEKTAKFTCVEVGEVGNGYGIGELCRIVDPQAYLSEITNITVSDGGSDVESDDHLRNRIAIAPESFSVAGPFGAYEFFTREASSLVTDVFIDSENPGEVDIYFLQNDDIPTAEVVEIVYNYLSNRSLRPLTDNLFVKVPVQIYYNIDLIYYIGKEDVAESVTIQQKVSQAVDDFILWQKSKIGRDINKTELEYKIRSAGAKRVEIAEPAFTVVGKNQVAVCNNVNVIFSGIEDD